MKLIWIRLMCIMPVLLLCVGCTSFDVQVKNAQKAIETSVKDLEYTPNDVIQFKTIRHNNKGVIWNERVMLLSDREDRTWKELHQYFAHDAEFPFSYELRVGESESDIEKIRWFQFNLDHVYTVYRLEFRRLQVRKNNERY
jgi:hypothetical protein